MPVLMKKTDWTATFEKASRANRVWRQQIVGRGGENLLSLPATGSFEVIFVEMSAPKEERRNTSAKDMIGFGKKFHAPRPTEEWMKELREGEE